MVDKIQPYKSLMLLIDLGFYFYYFDRRFGCCLLTLFRKLNCIFILAYDFDFRCELLKIGFWAKLNAKEQHLLCYAFMSIILVFV